MSRPTTAEGREPEQSASAPLRCCRLCGTPISQCAWGGGECESCGSVSVASLPTEDELAAYYRTYHESYSGGGRSGGRNLRRYAERYLRLVRRHAGPGPLLDVGSSRSPFPDLAAASGFSVSVMDYARPPDLTPAVSFRAGSLNAESCLEGQRAAYDVVTAWAVLEHVRDPRYAVRLLAGLCRPGGRIFLSTPEIGTCLTNHALGHSRWFLPPEHLHLISPRAIQSLFADQGCKLLAWGRLELSLLRFAARYGIGVLEAIVGWPFRAFCPMRWRKAREERTQRFQGIAWFVLTQEP